MAIIGSTGTGKTWAMSRLLAWGPRDFVILVRTKDDDTRLPSVFKRTRDVEAIDDPRTDRWVVDLTRSMRAEQAEQVDRLLEKVWEQRGWTVGIDELFYVFDRLRCGEMIEQLLTQGRGARITVVVGMQRPVRVTRFALSEVSHVLCFGVEGRDRATLAEATSTRFADACVDLPRHTFVWWSRRHNATWTGRIEDLEKT
jgi:hypothetical protein